MLYPLQAKLTVNENENDKTYDELLSSLVLSNKKFLLVIVFLGKPNKTNHATKNIICIGNLYFPYSYPQNPDLNFKHILVELCSWVTLDQQFKLITLP